MLDIYQKALVGIRREIESGNRAKSKRDYYSGSKEIVQQQKQ
ncbi:MAG: hypothetical protein ABSC11_01710 [Smithella sp.]|jgi:hypothetical protein